jgi:hypothetical protein
MTIKYVCTHCHNEIATINSSVTDSQLGLTTLSEQDKHDMISYDQVGNMHIHICCDYCYEALTAHPDLMQYNSPIH